MRFCDHSLPCRWQRPRLFPVTFHALWSMLVCCLLYYAFIRGLCKHRLCDCPLRTHLIIWPRLPIYCHPWFTQQHSVQPDVSSLRGRLFCLYIFLFMKDGMVQKTLTMFLTYAYELG